MMPNDVTDSDVDKLVTLMDEMFVAWRKEDRLRKQTEEATDDEFSKLYDAVLGGSIPLIGHALRRLHDEMRSGERNDSEVKRMDNFVGGLLSCYPDYEER